jgi:multidrug efflux pump subunit AcrA (membrane-fusion protein)
VKAAVLGLLTAVTVSAGGCASTPHQTTPENAPVAVTLNRVSAVDFASTFEAGGVVRARATTLIASRVMAPIAQIHVRPGDRVGRGDVLVTLDARDARANKGQADAAALSAAEAARAADADIRAAESALVLARATHDRMAALHAKRSATAQELDQAVAALAAAEAQHSSAQARVAAANASREAAKAAAESAAVAVTYAALTSPFDGVVTERRADPGSMATPGAPLLIVEDPSTYRLEVQIDDTRASAVAIGQTVSVRLDNAADDGRNWMSGRVVELARVDPSSHALLVKIDLPPSAALRSGLFGRARVPGPVRRALALPATALIIRGQLTFVYVVDIEGRARLRPISVGTIDSDRVEALAGVREGDNVVVTPPASLLDGARVTGAAR